MRRGWGAAALIAALALGACQASNRLGMVEEPQSGVLIGSAVEHNMFLDPAQFGNRTIKVTMRNTSGDPAFDLGDLRSRLEAAYAAKGFAPTDGDDYGLRLDVNVLASGRLREDKAREVGLIGAVSGGAAGYETGRRGGSVSTVGGTALGIVAGATAGQVLGSFVTDDTYFVTVDVSLGVTDAKAGATGRTILFSRSSRPRERDATDRAYTPFRHKAQNRIAVYAGGRNVGQAAVVSPVRERLVRILSDII